MFNKTVLAALRAISVIHGVANMRRQSTDYVYVTEYVPLLPSLPKVGPAFSGLSVPDPAASIFVRGAAPRSIPGQVVGSTPGVVPGFTPGVVPNFTPGQVSETAVSLTVSPQGPALNSLGTSSLSPSESLQGATPTSMLSPSDASAGRVTLTVTDMVTITASLPSSVHVKAPSARSVSTSTSIPSKMDNNPVGSTSSLSVTSSPSHLPPTSTQTHYLTYGAQPAGSNSNMSILTFTATASPNVPSTSKHPPPPSSNKYLVISSSRLLPLSSSREPLPPPSSSKPAPPAFIGKHPSAALSPSNPTSSTPPPISKQKPSSTPHPAALSSSSSSCVVCVDLATPTNAAQRMRSKDPGYAQSKRALNSMETAIASPTNILWSGIRARTMDEGWPSNSVVTNATTDATASTVAPTTATVLSVTGEVAVSALEAILGLATRGVKREEECKRANTAVVVTPITTLSPRAPTSSSRKPTLISTPTDSSSKRSSYKSASVSSSAEPTSVLNYTFSSRSQSSSSKPSTAQPSPTVRPLGEHCPYPYPGEYCEHGTVEVPTTMQTSTAKASSVRNAQTTQTGLGSCPYPGLEC